QPQGSTISQGNSAFLSVTATGTNPTYQWFIGTSPSGSPLPGGTSATLTVSPSSNTNYFVRVTACSNSVDSTTATVTVQCTPPLISSQPVGSSIIAGGSTQLAVNASGSSLTFQWFLGNSGDTSNPIPGATGQNVNVSPTTTTNYWVRVSGACGTPQNSTTVTVTVGACTSPVISNAGANPTNIQAGGSAVLSATVSGSVASTQWYRGTPPDKSNAVPQSGPTVSVSPTVDTTYWLQATSSCGAQATNSAAVIVTVGATCTKPSITTQPASQSVTVGLQATLKVTAVGTAPLHYQWFKGATAVRTSPVGTDSSSLTTE